MGGGWVGGWGSGGVGGWGGGGVVCWVVGWLDWCVVWCGVVWCGVGGLVGGWVCWLVGWLVGLVAGYLVSLAPFQWVGGVVAFLKPGLPYDMRSRIMPLHVFFGLALYVIAIATAISGLTEKAIFSK